MISSTILMAASQAFAEYVSAEELSRAFARLPGQLRETAAAHPLETALLVGALLLVALLVSRSASA